MLGIDFIFPGVAKISNKRKVKVKQIYKHDLDLTQIGHSLWPEVQKRMSDIFNLMPDANPMHVRQMISSALMMESSKRIIKIKREKSKKMLISRQRDASRILSPPPMKW